MTPASRLWAGATTRTTSVDQNRRPYLITERFRRWGIVAWALIGLLLLLSAAWWALLQVSHVFPPVVLALVTIYLLNPFVSSLERRGVHRLAATCLIYTVLLAIVAVALVFLVPMIVHQTQGFVRDFPKTIDRLGAFADRITSDIQRRFPTFDFGSWLGRRVDSVGENLGGVGVFLLGAVQTVALLVIGPIIAFYLLADLPRLRRSFLKLVPPERRGEVIEVAGAVGNAMGGFFRGQLIVAVIVGVLSSVAMLIVGIPYWLVVGMIAGFFNLIPLIGPYIGAIPGILIAGAYRTPIHMLWVALALTIVQQIDNHFISPNVMRLTVRLHPATVMLSLIAGATLAGFWGMLLAVPVTASVKLVAAHFWKTRIPWGREVFDAETEPVIPVPAGAGDPRDDEVVPASAAPPTGSPQAAEWSAEHMPPPAEPVPPPAEPVPPGRARPDEAPAG